MDGYDVVESDCWVVSRIYKWVNRCFGEWSSDEAMAYRNRVGWPDWF